MLPYSKPSTFESLSVDVIGGGALIGCFAGKKEIFFMNKELQQPGDLALGLLGELGLMVCEAFVLLHGCFLARIHYSVIRQATWCRRALSNTNLLQRNHHLNFTREENKSQKRSAGSKQTSETWP